jgi:hypothetical protein
MLTTMLTTCLFVLLAAEATALKFTWFQTEGTLELDLKVQCSGPVELKRWCLLLYEGLAKTVAHRSGSAQSAPHIINHRSDSGVPRERDNKSSQVKSQHL